MHVALRCAASLRSYLTPVLARAPDSCLLLDVQAKAGGDVDGRDGHPLL